LQKREFQRNDLPFIYWDGSPLGGKKILIYDEQGFGDAIQFLRFVKYLREFDCKIDCECKKKMAPLFRSTKLFNEVFERGAKKFASGDYHFKVSLLSLPFLLNISRKDVMITEPYINAG